MTAWIQFIISAGVVVVAGTKLSQYADVIAQKSRLGALWVGSILLALGTSLPELVAGVSAGLLGLPDLALGNVLGSNIFNIFIIAILDLIEGEKSILRKVGLGHILSGTLGMLLSAAVAIFIFLDLPLRVGWIGLDTVIIAAIYLYGLFLISRYESRPPEAHPVILSDGIYTSDTEYEQERLLDISLGRASLGFAVSALFVAVAGTLLSISSDRIATMTGLGSTFVGSTLLALATSLPELVASIAAASAGAFDLAIGNMFGSNIFNMVILVFSDLAYLEGPLLAAVSDTHILTGLFGLVLSTVAVMGLFYRSSRNIFRWGPDSVFIMIIYFLATWSLYYLR
ncbi:MAG: sodium:calcium antiporter [Firmicutes bacterium]|nr:sodium:calcium antiporter [Bacillota bacterium]